MSALIVEPNPRTAAQLARLLASATVSVQICGTRADALKVLTRKPVELVLAELDLPDGSGLTLLVDAHCLCPSAAFIVMGSRVSAEQVTEAWRLGARDIIFKPITRQGVSGALRRAATVGPAPLTAPPNVSAPVRTAPASSECELQLTVALNGDYDGIQQRLVREVVRRFDGNKAKAARALGMHRRTLYRLINRNRPAQR